MSEYNHTDELTHYGIPGQKWGLRRYQNKDGSLTAAGRKRVAKMKDEYTQLTGKKLIRKPTPKNSKSSGQNGNENADRKSIKNMSDTEIQNRINRLQKEKQLMSLQSETASKGEKFVSTVGKQVIAPAAIDAGKSVLTEWFRKGGKKVLGLDPTEASKDIYADLRKEVDGLELEARKINANKTINQSNKKEEPKKKSEKSKKEEVKTKDSKKEESKSEKVKVHFTKNDSSNNDSNKKKESVIIEADWKEVKSNSTALVPYRREGESFIDDLFKKKK